MVVVVVVVGGIRSKWWAFWSLEKVLKSVSTKSSVIEWTMTTAYLVYYSTSAMYYKWADPFQKLRQIRRCHPLHKTRSKSLKCPKALAHVDFSNLALSALCMLSQGPLSFPSSFLPQDLHKDSSLHPESPSLPPLPLLSLSESQPFLARN